MVQVHRIFSTRHLAFPFHAAPLLLVATFTFGLLLALQASLLGLWLGVILISWFFKYCFIMLDAIVAGAEEPPVLSIEMVNPVDEQRPVAAGALIAGAVWLVWTMKVGVGSVSATLLSFFLLALLPASLTTLAVTRNILKAIWPGAWIALLRGLGRDYAWLNGLVLICAGCIYGMWHVNAPLWLTLAVTQVSFLFIVAFIGSAVHEHRFELGIATLSRAERVAARDERDFNHERREMLDRAFSQLRVRRPLAAWEEIDRWLTTHDARGKNLPELSAIVDATSAWDEPQIADRLANEYVELLLARRQNGMAIDVCERRLARNPNFAPARAARLAELASLAGKRALKRQLEEKCLPSGHAPS